MKFVLIVCCILFLCQAQAQQATIFYNARIFTADPSKPFAEAVGIRGNTIVAVGKLDQVKAALGSAVVMKNLKGGFLMPGMVDAHNHAIDGGALLSKPNLFEELLPITELVDFARKQLVGKKGLTGDFLLIYGVNISTWMNISALNIKFNEAEFLEQPVYLEGSDGHTGWANRKMLTLAGINKGWLETLTASQKKYYGKGKDGEPTGFISDSGLRRIMQALPAEPVPDTLAAIKAVRHCNSLGITAWLDASAAELFPEREACLQAYQYLVDRKRLTAHVAATVVADPNADAQPQISKLKSLQAKYNKGNVLNIIGFKIFADGVLEFPAQTAAISIPYKNQSENGKLLFEPSRFRDFITLVDKQGLLVHVHAIGDLAVTETLNGFEAMRKVNNNDDLPHSITHLQLILPQDISRFQPLNILAVMQLFWAFGDITTIDIVQPYIAPALYKNQYPSRSLLRAGALICGASDWPISTANPFEAMSRAETRKGPMGVLDSTQRMPRMTMLYAYTRNAATAMLMDKSIGSLEPGKSADMILVDRDLIKADPESLSDAKILWTMFEGKLVYTASGK